MIGLGKFNKIIEIDYGNRCVVTQPGVSNLAISEAVAEKEFYYAPDRPVRSCAPLVGMWLKIQAGFIALNMA